MSVNLTRTQPRDRHLAALRAGILVKAMQNFAATDGRIAKVNGVWQRVECTPEDMIDRHFPEKDRPKDWDVFTRLSLVDFAAECLLAEGHDRSQVLRLPAPELAMAAMGFGRHRLGASAMHTTAVLPELTRDAVNKSLTIGYEEAPQTWRGPIRQGNSVPDFKQIHRVKLGQAPSLPVWIDNMAPEQARLSNERESYGIEARAETLSFSWKTVINDDLDAISRHPQLLGDAAARTINAVAWGSIISNPTMADGQPLFVETPAGRRYRSNYTTGAAVPTNTTIGSMKAKMRGMRGLNTPEGNESDAVLNIEPAFLVGPGALEETILKQVYSGADPAAGGNSAVYNTSRTLQPIIEPLLDANSLTAWYLFASPGRIDTAELTFLQGQETPYTHEWIDNATLSQNFSIIQTYGARALDFRGMQKHAGQ